MSQENVELIQQIFETHNRRGARTVARDYWHADIEWEAGPWGVVLGGRTHVRGREEAVALFEEIETVLGRFTMEVLNTADGSAGTFVEARLHGEGLESGAAVDQIFWYAVQVDGGRVRQVHVFGDRAEALEAVGLTE